jgi:hypothetical protein
VHAWRADARRGSDCRSRQLRHQQSPTPQYWYSLTSPKGLYVVDSPESYRRQIRYVNPKGIQSSSPGLAFFSQPWEPQNPEIQPQRGCVMRRPKQYSEPTQPFQGCEFDFFSPQGWLKNANPGLEDEIPSGFIPRLNSARCPGELTIEFLPRSEGSNGATTTSLTACTPHSSAQKQSARRRFPP